MRRGVARSDSGRKTPNIAGDLSKGTRVPLSTTSTTSVTPKTTRQHRRTAVGRKRKGTWNASQRAAEIARRRKALRRTATVRIVAAEMVPLSRTVDSDELERLLPSWHEVHAFRRGDSSPPAPAAEDESELVDSAELAAAVRFAMADTVDPERSDSATETKTRYLYGGKHVTEEDVRVAVRYWWHRLEIVTDEEKIRGTVGRRGLAAVVAGKLELDRRTVLKILLELAEAEREGRRWEMKRAGRGGPVPLLNDEGSQRLLRELAEAGFGWRWVQAGVNVYRKSQGLDLVKHHTTCMRAGKAMGCVTNRVEREAHQSHDPDDDWSKFWVVMCKQLRAQFALGRREAIALGEAGPDGEEMAMSDDGNTWADEATSHGWPSIDIRGVCSWDEWHEEQRLGNAGAYEHRFPQDDAGEYDEEGTLPERRVSYFFSHRTRPHRATRRVVDVA